MISPDVALAMSRDFNDVSPQVAAAFRINPRTLAYATFARAFKAGGFNPVSIPGSESYDEEHAWNIEAGVKLSSEDGRYGASAAVFSIDWDDLQLNLPIPFAAGAFFIDNVGAATSRGVEFEATARPMVGLDFFGNAGFTRARFASGTMIDALDVSGNRIPNTPAYTAGFGAQYSRTIRQHELFGRVDVGVVGAFQYDEANTAGQDAYALTNLRVGMRMSYITIEAWVRNAFDTRYVPLAFAFPGLNPSGFLAEPGRPRTFGVTAGVRW
jgi:iron complex outermembrane receptor protein